MAAEEGVVIGCHDLESWKAQFQKGKDSKQLVVVDFTAAWCGPCRFIAPVFSELAKKLPTVLFLKVDVDELPSVAKEWDVEGMPTFIFMKEGNIIDKIVGANKPELEEKVARHATSASA